MSKHVIDLNHVSKDFDGDVALEDISLYIRDGEFLTLLGPSGCGKTTMLRIVAGFETPTSGQVCIDGIDVTALPPYQRRVNTVFQRYALFPHMDVYENVAFGLTIKKKDRKFIDKKVAEMLELVELRGLERRSVEQLSGGQQQRVAIARALANEPEVLLLDEPLGALDLKLRKEMQVELKRMQKALGITFVYVTHDQEEALSMSDTIVVMRSGSIQQIGTPIDIYNEPKNAFVADFIGESNILPGVMKRDYLVSFGGRDYDCVDAGFAPNESIDVVIRPEDIKIVSPEAGMMRGVVDSVGFIGVHYEIVVDCGEHEYLVHSTGKAEPGQSVGLTLTPDDIHIMHALPGYEKGSSDGDGAEGGAWDA